VDGFSARWVGSIQAQYAEEYTFYLQTGADEGARLVVYTPDMNVAGGRKANVLVDSWDSPTASEQSGSIMLARGETYDIVIEYREGSGDASIQVSWESASTVKQALPVSQLYPRPCLANSVLSANWLVDDLGAPATSGLLISDSPMYAMTGAGTGLSGTADQCAFAFRELIGFGEIIMRVKDFAPIAGVSARTGLMLREGTGAEARFMAILAKPDGGAVFVKRTVAGASAVETEVSGGAFLRIFRNGPTVCAYVSETGLEGDWTFVGRADLMNLKVRVRMGVVTFSGASDVANTSNMTRLHARAIVPMGGNYGYRREFFIDALSFSDPLYSRVSTNTPGMEGEILSEDKDGSGWPTCDFSWKVANGVSKVSGLYDLVFTGQAEISFSGTTMTITTQSYDVVKNRTHVQINCTAANGPSSQTLYFSNTIREPGGSVNTGLTSMRLIQPGYGPDAGLINNEGLRYARIAQCGPLRSFGSLPLNWDNRTKPDAPSWISPTTGNINRPVEILIAICNELGLDLWINMPASGVDGETGPDDEYVQSLANLLANGSTINGVHYEGLRPDLNVYVEWGNESWNGIFPGCWRALNGMQYALESNTTFGTEGLTLDYDGKSDTNGWDKISSVLQYRWIGARMKQISDIFLEESNFGSDARKVRVRTVLAGRNSFVNTTEPALDFVKAAWPNEADDVFYAVSGTSYFGSSSITRGGPPAT